MELVRRAPSIFQLFESSEMNPWMFSNWGIAMAMGAALVLCMLLWRCRDRLTPGLLLDGAFLMVLAVPFLLPHMHERYFFMADMLALVYFAGRFSRVYAPALVVLASFNGYLRFLQYYHTFVPQVVGALAMLLVMVLVGAGLMRDLQRTAKEPASDG